MENDRASSSLCSSLACMLLFTPLACQRKPPPQQPSANKTAPVVAASKRPMPAGQTQQDTAAIDAFFQAWLAAQNQGSFDKYQALYAQKFQGVRRSGPRVRRFDRAFYDCGC